MCQPNGFVGSLFGEVKKVIRLDPEKVGGIHLGCLPPRSAAFGEKDAFFAAGSVVSFLANCGFATQEDIFNQKFTPEATAVFLVKIATDIINSNSAEIFRRPAPEDFGKKRIYLLFLSAVLALFLDLLFSRCFKKSFDDNIRRAFEHLNVVLAEAELRELRTVSGGRFLH